MARAGPAWKRDFDERGGGMTRRRYYLLLSFIPVCAVLLIISELAGSGHKLQTSKAALQAAWNELKHTDSSGPNPLAEKSPSGNPGLASATSRGASTSTSGKHASPTATKVGSSDANITTLEPQYVDNGHGMIYGLEDYWYSPNHLFRLHHQSSGDLVLEQHDVVVDSWSKVWNTGTGSLQHGQIRGKSAVRLDRQGKMRIEVQAMDGERTLPVPAKEVWHSDLAAQCGHHVLQRQEMEQKSGSPLLRLDNDGRLDTVGATGDVHCVLYAGTSQSWYMKDRYGRLALLIAGPYKELVKTCGTHRGHLIEQWPGWAVDVFFYSFYESEDEKERERQITDVRDCYGGNLKDVMLAEKKEANGTFAGDLPSNCERADRGKLDEMVEQLREVDQAAEMYRQHVLKTSTKYDAVARIRPDTEFRGGSVKFEPPRVLGAEKLVVPQRDGAAYRYCSMVDGSVKIGAADQLFYGHPVPASIWLDLHKDFEHLLHSSQSTSAATSYTGCQQLPSGVSPRKCADEVDQCSLDCIVPYYLSTRGIDVEVDWTWGQSMLI